MLSGIALLSLFFFVACAGVIEWRDKGLRSDLDDGWRWIGTPVALVGRPVSVSFYRHGTPPITPQQRTVDIVVKCADCAPLAQLDVRLVSRPASELEPGHAEGITARVSFPAEGRWVFEPLGGELIVRSPTSTEPPVVVVADGSAQLRPGCGTSEVAQVVANFASAFNAADPAQLAQIFREQTDFSMTGEPLEKFVTQGRDAVAEHARARTLAGERLFPYFVQAGANADNSVDLGVYLVRQAPELPSVNGYRRVFAGSRLSCADLHLLRFNADVLDD